MLSGWGGGGVMSDNIKVPLAMFYKIEDFLTLIRWTFNGINLETNLCYYLMGRLTKGIGPSVNTC